MTRRRGAALVAALVLAGCATHAGRDDGDADAMAAALAGRTAGAAQRCISPSDLGGPQIIGDTLLYREGRRLWVSRPVDGCPSLRGDVIPIVEMQGGQLCANDRFRTIQRGSNIPGPYCRFGPFVPWVKGPS